MRDFRFRAWHKEANKMLPNNSQGYEGNVFRWLNEGQPVEIMQYTGLKDKNGEEIYEGDILQDDCEELHQVIFGKLPLDKSGDCVCTYEAFYCKCYGKLGQSPFYECANIGDWMEVIGNIYENPKLLEP